MNILISNIIRQLDEVQNKTLWVGPNFSSRLNLLSEEEAFTIPAAGLHSVAQIIAHLTVWRKGALIKIKTGAGNLIDSSVTNWPGNEQLKGRTWKAIYEKYQNSLADLVAMLESKQDSFLKEKYYDIDFKRYCRYEFMLNGLLHHDLYHLGQIGIIIKFLHSRAPHNK